jgi:uncharacterized protein YndB with AHSA1/START domain
METPMIKRDIWIAASRERTWSAITEPNHLEQWYAPGCPWEIPSLEVGTIVKFYNTDTDIQFATIDIADHLHQLTLRWQIDPTDSTITLVNTFLLAEENGGTHITVTQTGYESLSDDIRQEQINQDMEAYSAIIQSLKSYLER